MIKKALILSVALMAIVLYGFVQGQDKNKVTESEKIKASKIKCKTELHYLYKFGKPQGNGEKKNTIMYNTKGKATGRIFYKGDGLVLYKDTYKYDDKGNLIEEETKNPNGTIASKVVNRYDEKGNKIEDVTYKADGSISYKNTHKFDEQGHEIEQMYYEYYKGNGTLGNRSVRIYYTNGNCEETVYDKNDAVLAKTSIKTDEKGNIIEQLKYNPDGKLNKLIPKIEFKYDEKGNEIEEIYYDDTAAKVTGRQVKTYDKNGNVLEVMSYDSFNEIDCSWKYVYEYYK